MTFAYFRGICGGGILGVCTGGLVLGPLAYKDQWIAALCGMLFAAIIMRKVPEEGPHF